MIDVAPEPPIEINYRTVLDDIADSGFDAPAPADIDPALMPRTHRVHPRADCTACMQGEAHPISRCGPVASRPATGQPMPTHELVAALEAAGLTTIAVIPTRPYSTGSDAA